MTILRKWGIALAVVIVCVVVSYAIWLAHLP